MEAQNLNHWTTEEVPWWLFTSPSEYQPWKERGIVLSIQMSTEPRTLCNWCSVNTKLDNIMCVWLAINGVWQSFKPDVSCDPAKLARILLPRKLRIHSEQQKQHWTSVLKNPKRILWKWTYRWLNASFCICFKIIYRRQWHPTPVLLPGKIPWMEEPGRLQSMESLRVGHDWATSLSLFTFMHWSRRWQPTPVFLPGESQGRRSLVGFRLWGRIESDTTEAT